MVYHRERIEIYIRQGKKCIEVLYIWSFLVLSCEVLKSTDFLKSMCDNMHEYLPPRKAQPSLSNHMFYWSSITQT